LLHGAARPREVVHGITGLQPMSLHQDISSATGEEVVIFALGESPSFRDAR
jgi:uncharacterized protein YbcI